MIDWEEAEWRKKIQSGVQSKEEVFLLDAIIADQVFTPEDYTDEHKLIAKKTTEDFIVNEVLPELEYLEDHEFERSVKLLKQAGGRLGCSGRMYRRSTAGSDLIKSAPR
ncbi:hypothetical protein GCM10020331_028230 [Ectobacillus funiculus]